MVFGSPMLPFVAGANRKCDYSKIITHKMALLSNYCFLTINYCY